MEPDATPDLVGRTSARLLADGVGRLDRLEALRLLAVLDASTDANGRVRRPLDDLAAEFELPTMGVMRSLDHLERAGAIQREDGGTVLLLDRDEDLGGIHLADFLDDVRASFDDPVPSPAPTHSPWMARAGAALVAVAAAVGIIALAPSQPAVQPVATGPTSSVAAAPSSTSSTSAGRSSVVPPSSALDRTPFEPGASTAVPGADTTVVAATRCPTGAPTAEIVGNLVRLSNPTSADVVVLSLDIGGILSPTTLAIPAGQHVDYALPAPPPSASIGEWDWSDPNTAGTCPS